MDPVSQFLAASCLNFPPPSTCAFYHVHFTAAGADARHLRFAETFNLGHLISLWVSILQRLFYVLPENIRFM